MYLPPPVEIGSYSYSPSKGGRLRVLIGERELDRPRNNVRRFLTAASSLPPRLAAKMEVVLVGEHHKGLTAALNRLRGAGAIVRRFGYLQRDMFLRLLESSQLTVCLRDIWDQGGYWVLEGMARGIPTLLADSPAFRDLGPAGVTVAYVDVGQVEAITGSLTYLLDNPSELEKMSRNSYGFMVRNHSLQSVGARMRKAYEDLLSARSQPPDLASLSKS